MARPTVEFDDQTLRSLEMMLERFTPLDEACRILGISKTTLWRRSKTDERIKDVLEAAPLRARDELRDAQHRSAVKRNNVKMQQWLGMQYLGQRYRSDSKVIESKERVSIWDVLGITPEDLTSEELDVLTRILAKAKNASA